MAEIGIAIAEYLVAPTLRQLRYMFCFNNIVKDLRQENRILTVAQEQVQNDVNRARGNAEEIRKDVEMWLTDTNTFIEDVKSLENEAQENKSCLNGWCPNLCCRYSLSRKAAKKTLAIIKLQESGKFTQVGDPANLPNPGFFSSEDFLSSKATESATKQITEALNDENVNMIGLHGMGGTGKTTLVKNLGGRAMELKLFDVVVIVVVSQTPNVKKIQREIAEQLRLKFDEETEGARASRLGVRLKSENKILIILDDVWASLDLTEIGIPFGNDHKGCKILLTTRIQHVCTSMGSQKTIKLDALLEDEAWALFKKNTGLGNDSSSLTNLAMEVARECKGLPLAIVAVGRALRGKTPDEYMEALEQLKKSRFVNIQNADKEVYACLKLSYDYLKSMEIKSCFLLCSLFPEDYEIHIEDLARIGWGIGLFQEAETIESARRKMRIMMKTLQNSGLLIDTDKDQFVKMHDIVRDVALWIASKGENVFMVRAGVGLEEWPKGERFEQYTAISLMANKIKALPSKLECPKLEILLLGGDDSLTVPETFFEGMKALKVLTLRHGVLCPQSLEFLTNLRTLRLEYCDFKDRSLGKLKRLEVLSFRGSDIEELPSEVGELNNLKLLDLSDCQRLERIPPNVIRRLSLLEEFYFGNDNSLEAWEIEGSSVERSIASISELNSLSHLAVLAMELNPKYLPQDFSFHNLARYNLCLLGGTEERSCYRTCYSSDDSREGSYDYPDSRKLMFHGVDASSEVNAFKELFQTVELLDLEKTYGCQNIIPNMDQGGLNNLISLHLDSCGEMECLIDSTHKQMPTTAFSNLEDLSLREKTDLREMCYGNRPPKGFLQKLKTLKVEQCHNILSLFPEQLLQRSQNLEKVIVDECEKVQEVFGLKCHTYHVADGNHVMLLSNLLSLYLRKLLELKYIWKGPTQYVSLQSLRDVTILECHRVTYLFSSSLAQSLVQLQSLSIHKCMGLEQIIVTKKKDGEILSEAHLQPLCFSKLTTLKITECKKLEYIFPISVARDLRLLEELIISDVPQLKQVFGHGREEDGNDIELPKLRKLELQSLSSLTSFYEGNYHWMCPSLQVLIVLKCPILTTSFITDLEANLSALQKQLIRVLAIGDHIQLHKAVIHLLKEGLPNLERLIIENYEGVEELFDGISSFPNLDYIYVGDCNKLKSLSPITTMALCLPKLRTLWIESASQLEEVFRHENEEEDVRDDEKKKIELQKLGYLFLKELPRLISFCPRDYHFIFPSLHELYVGECPNITTSFSIDSDRYVHAKAETPQLVKEDMAEGSSLTSQTTVATRPSDSYIYWNNHSETNPLPPYME